MTLDRFQYTTGVGYNIMEQPEKKIPHIEGIWLPTVRAYLASIKGSMQIAGLQIQPLERHGDQYILDVALTSKVLTECEIKFINYCRLYLQVLTISDLCNTEGTSLSKGILAG